MTWSSNVLKGKKLTNIRTTPRTRRFRLTPPIRMTLEKALAYIEDDELVEVTPKSIRLRKKLLDETDRKREDRRKPPPLRQCEADFESQRIESLEHGLHRATVFVRRPRCANSARPRVRAMSANEFFSESNGFLYACGQ